jgi:phosphoglycolate phosphatase-like HAD superfamily hydrolase
VEKIQKVKSQLAGDDAVYYVGDAVSDIHAARQAGVKSVAVGWGHQSLVKLIKSQPDYIVHIPQEISALFENGAV